MYNDLMLECTIEWNSLDLPGWEARFAKIRRSTLLQSYEYARGVCPVYHQSAMWGLIRIGGAEAGLVQMLEAKLFGRALHAMAIDRGPLWFPGYGGVMHIRAFFDEIQRQFPGRFGRRRRIIPEIPKSPTADSILQQAGFFHIGPDYTTTWLDLTPSPEELRARLKGNWRGHLTKAERGPLTLEWDEDGVFLEELIAGYQADQAVRHYPGPAPKIVRAVGQAFVKTGHCMIGRAVLDKRTVSSILILRHGCAATYQVGWNDAAGRQHGGHYRLLWTALERLKDKGITDFDLGGIHDDSAENVSAFKDGLGGSRVTLAGLYS